jgi:hypothetical protein
MEALPDVVAAVRGWLTGPVLPVLTLLGGYLAARLVGAFKRRKAAAGAEADAGAGTPAESSTGDRSRFNGMEALLARLEQENRYLEQALAHRSADIDALTARMSEAAARDREELVRLQEELEADQRIGVEKARLIRVLEASLQRAESRRQRITCDRERQRVSVAALQAALRHAKRAQASTEGRLVRLREQLRLQAAPQATQPPAPERVVERIVEVPVETIVYRDREVPVEVPIEVPVGFTALAPPAAGGLKPRYSENRPNSS